MVSKTTKLEAIRQRKERRRGGERKAKLENHGTTPKREELFRVQKP